MAEKAKGKHKFGTLNPDAIESGITRNKKKQPWKLSVCGMMIPPKVLIYER